MRSASILALLAPVALAANVTTTITAPACNTVAGTAGSTGAAGGAGGSGAGNGTVNGTPHVSAGSPRPTATIVTAGAAQHGVSAAMLGLVAAGAAFIL